MTAGTIDWVLVKRTDWALVKEKRKVLVMVQGNVFAMEVVLLSLVWQAKSWQVQ